MQELKPNNFENQDPPVRPQVLTVLCILSYIASGISSFSFLMVYLSYSELLPAIKEMGSEVPGMGMILSASRNFFLTGFIFYFLSLMGVSLMWRLKRVGFHIYTGAQVALLFLPMLFIQGYPFPIVDGLIAALFVFFYYRFYSLFS